MANLNLKNARSNKNDEFYTLLADIENELKWYKTHFKNKIVYCNCDNPLDSNFVKFFQAKFHDYGLKKLIATHYVSAALTTTKLEMTSPDECKITEILGDGSYSSPASIQLLQEADIVVTNPPFSLFREYTSTLLRYQKSFLLIGSMNAITYKQIFPLLKDDLLWLGVNNVNRFLQPDGSFKKFGNICWFTNIEHYKRNTPILLYKKYSDEYKQYENCDAIEVSKVKNIPLDYSGPMGVPISILTKYCPDQFQILGLDDHTVPWRGKGPELDGKILYRRLIIKHKVKENED
jgi:hypothetical protein